MTNPVSESMAMAITDLNRGKNYRERGDLNECFTYKSDNTSVCMVSLPYG
jgi:hypothetical protein